MSFLRSLSCGGVSVASITVVVAVAACLARACDGTEGNCKRGVIAGSNGREPEDDDWGDQSDQEARDDGIQSEADGFHGVGTGLALSLQSPRKRTGLGSGARARRA